MEEYTSKTGWHLCTKLNIYEIQYILNIIPYQ